MQTDKMVRYAVGVDLGGTFVKVALISDNGEIVFETKLPIGGKASKKTILDTIERVIQMAIDKADKDKLKVVGIGVGTPGIVYEGVILGGAENLKGWENLDLSTYYSKLFNLPVLVDNDANVMGLGEVKYGAAKGCTDVVCLTIGTGVGGAIIANGELYGGYKNRGAELGHVVVEHNGPVCNCGGKGCLEVYSSTTALIKHYADLSGLEIKDINGHMIIEKFKENEDNAVKCLEKHTEYLGHGVASFINTFAPQKVVIGGGISEAGQFYIDMIRESSNNYVMPNCGSHTEIVAAKLGNTAGSLGAASLIFKNY